MSVEAIFDTLEPVMTRWTMGGPASSLAPHNWQGGLQGQNPEESELRLLALAGQYLGLCVAPTPPGGLTALPDIPPLALAVLPDSLASLARRCLKALKESQAQRDLVCLLAARGYAVHPADWMPSRQDDAVPDAYAPWRDWAERVAGSSTQRHDSHDELTEANWADWWPAARRIALARIRAQDPARATALLAARAAGEGAEVRLKLIECLRTGLNAADIPYLESLSSDRAPKIKALAASLLARLGHGSGNDADAAELAGFFAIQTKGLLRRTQVLTAHKIKTPAQRSRRSALLAQVDFDSLARALGVSSEALVALWPFGEDAHADHEFVASAEQSAAAPVIDALFARLMAEPKILVPAILALKPRLDTDRCRAFAQRLLGAAGSRFADALAIAGAGAELDQIMETRAGKALIDAVSGPQDIAPDIRALAAIASQSAARAALDQLSHAGLTASDPRLDLLRLNAALNHHGATA